MGNISRLVRCVERRHEPRDLSRVVLAKPPDVIALCDLEAYIAEGRHELAACERLRRPKPDPSLTTLFRALFPPEDLPVLERDAAEGHLHAFPPVLPGLLLDSVPGFSAGFKSHNATTCFASCRLVIRQRSHRTRRLLLTWTLSFGARGQCFQSLTSARTIRRIS